KRYALGSCIRRQHLHLYNLPDLHRLGRLLYVPVRQLANVDEAVLVDADVHERSETRHVGHDTLQNHTGLEVGYLLDIVAELRSCELVPRVAPRLAQLFPDIRQRIDPYGFGTEVL